MTPKRSLFLMVAFLFQIINENVNNLSSYLTFSVHKPRKLILFSLIEHLYIRVFLNYFSKNSMNSLLIISLLCEKVCPILEVKVHVKSNSYLE